MNVGQQYKDQSRDTVFKPPQGSSADIQLLMTQHLWPYGLAIRYREYITEGYSHVRALWMLSPQRSASNRSSGSSIQ